jgi:hypothetical protein
MSLRTLVQNEQRAVLSGVDIEVFSLDTGKVLAVATTGVNGIATFDDQAAGTYWFRPRLTRSSAGWGQRGQTAGALHFYELPRG